MATPRTATLAAAGCLALLVTGCSSTATGDPTSSATGDAAPTSSSATSSSATSTASSPAGAVQQLKDTDPCDLLTAAELKSLGVTEAGKPDDSVTSRGCMWHYGHTGTFSVAIRAEQGIDSLYKHNNGGTITSKTINDRPAMQEDNGDGCAVAVSVTKTSRVDTSAILDHADKDCAAAQQVAKVVEKHLPGT